MPKTNLQQRFELFTGSYAPADQEGIQVLQFDAENGRLQRISGFSGIENPSFLTFDSRRNVLFAVSETNDGAVVSMRYDPEKKTLSEISRQKTHGSSPCHLSLDETGRWLLAVNYMGGNVALYSVEEDGTIAPASSLIQHEGQSVQSDRQEAPHPHSIVQIPQTDYWMVPDLGTDHLVLYKLDDSKGELCPHGKVPTEPGGGPRHAAFHPAKPLVYVINELNSTITGYRLDPENGLPDAISSITTLPEGFSGTNICADVHISPSGDFLYGSNRGHDSLAVFRIQDDGRLEPIGITPVFGKTPRNFALVGNTPYLLAANQDSDSIIVFKLSESGLPAPTGERFELCKPVCVKVRPISEQ